ncbi:MAG TPA: hypothetical protein VH440_04430 [Candidatus Limnocylindrales bacterium]
MIAVIGSPIGRRDGGAVVAAGLSAAVARSAVLAGASVQVVGKVGEGPAGDAILLSVAAVGVGHVAVLRDLAPSPVVDDTPETEPERPIDEVAHRAAFGADPADADAVAAPAQPAPTPTGPSLDAADLQLALQYLPDYRVVVIAQRLDEPAFRAVVEAATWSGARLIVVAWDGAGAAVPLPDDATVLEAPTEDAEGAFASLVGRYAAALDGGATPAEAFAAASADVGWSAVAD